MRCSRAASYLDRRSEKYYNKAIFMTTPEDENKAREHEPATPVGPERATESEPTESFVDSRGIERKTEFPLVLLDTEAREAVDTYFVEHEQLAETGEAVLVALQEAESVDLSSEQFKESLTLDLKQPAEAPGDSTKGTAEASPELEKEITELQRLTDELTKVPSVPTDADYDALERILSGLDEETRQKIASFGTRVELSWKDKVSKSRREALSQALAGSLRIISDGAATSVRIQESRVVDEFMADFGEVETFVQEKLSVEDTEKPLGQLSEKEAWQRLDSVRAANTPIENDTIMKRRYGALSEAIGAPAQVRAELDEVCAQVERNPLWSVARHLSPEGQEALQQRASEALWRMAEKAVGTKMRRAHKIRREAVTAAKKELANLTSSLYQEQALPVLYISDTEVEHLQRLAEAIAATGAIRDFSEGYAKQKVKEARSTVLSRCESTGQIYYHATAFASDILESGELMPKQMQIDKTGVLHEQMHQENPNPNRETHSSVPHFSKSIHPDYLQKLDSDPDTVAGVIGVPLGDIVEQAPIDAYSCRLKVLSAAEGRQAQGNGMVSMRQLGSVAEDMTDDFVFYAEPEFERSDKYTIPIDGGVVALVGAEDTPIPPELEGRVKVVSRPLDIPQAIGEEVSRVSRERGGSMVVPLRQEAVPFETESPVSLHRRNVPFIRRKLNTSKLREHKFTSSRFGSL